VTPELGVAVAALVTAFVGAVVSFRKVGPERQVSIVSAQDVVIENLREEIARYQRELESTRKRHRARMDRAEARVTELENELAEETKRCDERIAALAVRIADLEREPRRRGV
jgi:septal ring factor EnvC (AmiA/AmiB activator)